MGDTRARAVDLAFANRAVWAFTWTAQAERTPEAIAATCRAFAIDGYQQEVFYGLAWQGAIDRARTGGAYGAPASEAELTALRDTLLGAGIRLIPVVVPRGLPGEAELHATAARLCGAIVVDMESDSSGDYWPWDRAGLVRVYARALREACGPEVVIGWQPDGRLADPGRAAEWDQLVAPVVQYVDAFLPQLYAGWAAYGRGGEAVRADSTRFARFAALRPTYPTLCTGESLMEPLALWAAVQDQARGFCAFRFGLMDGRALAAVRDMPVAGPAPEPEPQPEPEPEPAPVTLDGVKLGLIDKVLREDWTALARDAAALRG